MFGKKFLTQLIRAGVRDIPDDASLAIRVMIANGVSLFAVVICLIMTIIQASLGQTDLLPENLVCAGLYSLVIFANQKNLYNLSRALTIVFSLLMLVTFSWLFGIGVGLYLFAYACAGCAFFMFRASESRWIALVLLATLAVHLFLYSRMDAWKVGAMESMQGSYASMQVAFWLFSIVASILPSAMFFYLNQRYEREIESSRLQLIQASHLSTLGELAGGIAHEINNPLTVISGRTRTLARQLKAAKADRPEFLETLEKIDATVFRISRISNSLRRLGHAANGGNTAKSDVAVRQLLDDLLVNYDIKFKEQGIALRLDIEDATVRGVPHELTHVFLNVLTNAVQALEQCSVRRIEITGVAAGARYELRFSNSGPLIDEKTAARIFDPFFTTKPVGQGTGLGLSLARRILTANGGAIELLDREGETTFLVSIPLGESWGGAVLKEAGNA
jgi:signal transduction histidine kinase